MIWLVAILRVSTEEQANDDRAGLDRQRATIERRAATLDAKVVKWITVVDVTRVRFVDTPEWQDIRERIRDPRTHLICDQADRFVAGLEAAPILVECRATGTKIYTNDGEVDLAHASGRFVAMIKALVAADEIETTKHRVHYAKEAKRRRAEFPTCDIALATGIRYDRKERRWTYTADIARVQRAYKLYAEGLHNFAAIGRDPDVRASGQTVKNWLCNDIFAGWMVYDEKRDPGTAPVKEDGRRKDRRKVPRAPDEVIRVQVYRPRGEPCEPGDNREEAAVHQAVVDSVRHVMHERREAYQMARGPVGSRFHFTGYLWCDACVQPMWGRSRRGAPGASHGRSYYACRLTKKRKKCPTGYLPRTKVHSCLDVLFTSMLSDPRLVEGLVDAAALSDGEDHLAAINRTKQRLERLDKQRSKLLDLYLSAEWSRADLDNKRLRIDQERERLERELRRLEGLQRAAASDAALDRLREMLLTLHEFEFWGAEQKRRLVGRFFPRISLSATGVEKLRVKIPVVAKLAGREIAVPENELPLDLHVGLTWEELTRATPEPVYADFGLPEQPFYTRRDVRRMLGLKEHQVCSLMRDGAIPEPQGRHHGKRAWSAEEMKELHDRFAERRRPYRWGLPRKRYYRSGDVTGTLGVGWERLRYLLETGALPDCERRDAQGRRQWTEGEVERVVDAYRGHVAEHKGQQLDA